MKEDPRPLVRVFLIGASLDTVFYKRGANLNNGVRVRHPVRYLFRRLRRDSLLLDVVRLPDHHGQFGLQTFDRLLIPDFAWTVRKR